MLEMLLCQKLTWKCSDWLCFKTHVMLHFMIVDPVSTPPKKETLKSTEVSASSALHSGENTSLWGVWTGGLVKAAGVSPADTRHVELLVLTALLQQPAGVRVKKTAAADCGESGGCEAPLEVPQTTAQHTHTRAHMEAKARIVTCTG